MIRILKVESVEATKNDCVYIYILNIYIYIYMSSPSFLMGKVLRVTTYCMSQ